MSAEYELVLMLDPEVPDERRDEIATNARGRIESSGSLKAEKAWGLRKLAYEIGHRNEADYRFFRFETESPLLNDLDHNLKITDGVLRFRIFKVDPDSPVIEPPPPAPLASSAPRGPGRRGRGAAETNGRGPRRRARTAAARARVAGTGAGGSRRRARSGAGRRGRAGAARRAGARAARRARAGRRAEPAPAEPAAEPPPAPRARPRVVPLLPPFSSPRGREHADPGLRLGIDQAIREVVIFSGRHQHEPVVITGNLTRDPELRSTGGGTPVCELRVAVNSRRKDQSGNWVDKPNYFDVTVLGAQGENCATYLSKGRPVAVEGRLDWREWEAKDGSGKRQAVSIIANSVQFLGSREAAAARAAATASTPQSDVPADTSDFDSPEAPRP